MATDTTPALETRDLYQPAEARSLRRRIRLERLTYGAATLGITIAPHYDSLWPAHLTAAGIAAGAVWRLLDRWEQTPIGASLLKACQKMVPVLTGSGLYLANLLRPGADVWEYGLPAGWFLLMAATTPLTHSTGLTNLLPDPDSDTDAPALEAAAVQDTPPATFPEYRAWQWQQSGAGRDTLLTNVRQYCTDNGQLLPDFDAVVVAETGKAVPTITTTALAAAFDFPDGTVHLHPIDGSGPGRKHLTARPTQTALAQTSTDSVHRIFNEKLATPNGGAPGMLLADYKREPNRIALRVTAPDDQMIQLNQKQIARALGYKDTGLIMIETDGLGDGVVSVYKNHPLLTVREATAEDLTMDADGTIAIGLRPDGRQARVPLYDPAMGAVTDLYVGAPGAGKSVTLLTLLAAERINGIVSIVADAQDGMSIPEAEGRVYHFGKGVAATAATLAASNELAKYREKISAANGWGSFEPGQPWRIANETLDELNRILSADSTVPRPFRKWVTGLVGDSQATGRKLGKGNRFAAQSIHLADLGDKDRIRANAKNGTVWLGRTNSSTTQHMATDGVLPAGVYPEPIPRYFKTGNGSDIDAAFQGKEAKNGPITAGMANIIQGGTVFLARTWFARKENKTYPGLIALLESAPIPRLSPEEDRVFQDAYARWLPHAELLLAGEDGEEDGDYTADVDMLADDQDDDQPPASTIKQRILNLLADGPLPLKDVRAKMPDAAPGSVNNAMNELREAGLVTPVSRGVYQLAE